MLAAGGVRLPRHGRSDRSAVGGARRRWRPAVNGPRRRRRCPTCRANGSAFAGYGSAFAGRYGSACSSRGPPADADGQTDAVAAATDATDAADATVTRPRPTAGPRRRAPAGHDPTVARHAGRHAAAVVPTAERRPRSAKSRPTVAPERSRQAERPLLALGHGAGDTSVVSNSSRSRCDSSAGRSRPDCHETGARRGHPRRRRPQWAHSPVAPARRSQPSRRRVRHAALAHAVPQAE